MIALLLALMLVGALLAGCARQSGGEQPPAGEGGGEPAPEPTPVAEEQYLNHYIGDEPPDLNTMMATDVYSFTLASAMQEGLVRQGLDGSYEQGSGLAESWEVSPDGTVWTFKLRDAKWSNGTPLTANDFVFAWKYAADPRNGAEYGFMMNYLKGGEAVTSLNPEEAGDEAIEAALNELGVKALDDKTLEVTLERPVPYFLSLLAFPTFFPVNQAFFEEMGGAAQFGGNYGTEPENLIYIGPFKLVEWVHDTRMVFEKNPDYWDADSVKLETLNLDIVQNNSTAVNMFEAGELDRVGIGADFVDQYLGQPNVTKEPDGSVWYIQMNHDNELFQNKKIRQALSLAIDREVLAIDVLKTHLPAKAYTSSVISDNEGQPFVEKWIGEPLWPQKANADEAKRLLQEGLQELGLSEFPAVKLLTDESDLARKRDQALQEMWRQNLGIEVELDPVDFATRLERSRNRQFDMVFSGWGPDYDDPQTFLDMWVTDGDFNDGGYSNPAYDEIVARASAAVDNTERMEAWVEAERMMAEEIPVIVVSERVRLNATKPWVKNLKFSAFSPEYEYKWVEIEGRE